MASIGSLSAGTSANLYGASVKGFTGLASGMDVDSMIEKMTYGTRKKIDKQMADRQTLVWKQEAYRSVSSKLIDFNNNFLSMSASDSLNRVSTFARSIITSQGLNSSKVSVTGASPALDNLKIHSVDQLATNSSLTGGNKVTDGALTTGELDIGGQVAVQNLGDTYLEFKYGGKTYSAFLDSSKDYSDAEKAAKAINEVLMTVDTADHAKLGEKIKIEYDAAAKQFSFVDLQTDGKNMVSLSGGADAALAALGMSGVDLDAANNIGAAGSLSGSAVTDSDLITQTDFDDYVGGKQLYFSYNGVSKSITLPKPTTDASGNPGPPYDTLDHLKSAIQTALDNTFGTNTITVSADVDLTDPKKGSLSFTAAESCTIRVTGGETGLLGVSGALKMQVGDGNRLNLDGKITDTNLNPGAAPPSPAPVFAMFLDKDGKEVEELALSINGVRIQGLGKDSTMRDVIQAINDSDAGVKISYMETADKFTITASNGGTAGKIEFDTNMVDKDGQPITGNYAQALFAGSTAANYKQGQDAIMKVSYGDSPDVIEVVRNSNSFKFEGASFTLNGRFKADENVPEEFITFVSKPDTENVAKKVKEMVDAYNELIDEVYKQSSTKPNRKYPPLTDEQKSKMTESEIKNYEDKAKEGLLFNDSDLSGIANKMRYVFSGVTNVKALEDMGLRVSTSYSEHGKITFDEEKFKAAMDQDSDAVQRLFTGTVDGKGQDGFMARMKGIYETYGKTEGFVKGSLITIAGSPASATSLLDNSIQKQIDQIDKDVKTLSKKLQTEIDRYNSQFTQLEKLVAQMNSQSSALSSFM